jgi:3-phenylpropionate/trans-cinnamate dioxygenase ferredoxin reductase component
MSDAQSERACIVGAGQAGAELAFALRQQGWTAAITLIGDEPHLPYQRPPLSKAYLHVETDPRALYLRQRAAYEQADIEVIANARVERIDLAQRVLVFAKGRELSYSKLALATGGRPRRLALDDIERIERAGNFHYLRTIDDAAGLRRGFEPGRRLVIVGGGYVGLEVAASAIKCGLRVTVLEALPRVLARVGAPEMSRFYADVHRGAGVDLRTGVQVVSCEVDPAKNLVTAVECADGTVLPADLVVVGIGLLPNVELALQAGIAIDNGIAVSEHGRTSDSHVVAAGDCAARADPQSGRRVRLESVPNAIEQARAAAATLAGKQRSSETVPWFWSDQYDLKLQMAGLSQGHDQVVLRGSVEERSFSAFYFRQGRLIAGDCVNRPGDFMAAKKLLAAGTRVDPQLIADESVPLRSQHAG